MPILTFSPLNGNINVVSKVDLVQLAKEIRQLNRHQKLYRVLRDELSKIGHWKQRVRGNPMKAYLSRGKGKHEYSE